MNATNYAEKRILNNLIGIRIVNGVKLISTPPNSWYLALFTGAPVDANEVLINGLELEGNGYARVQIPNEESVFPQLDQDDDSVLSIKSNVIAYRFPVATLQWSAASHYGIYDAAVAGHLWFWGALSSPLTVLVNQSAEVSINALTISLA